MAIGFEPTLGGSADNWYIALKQGALTSNLKKGKDLTYAMRKAELDRNATYNQDALKMRYDEEFRQKQLAQNKEQYEREMSLKEDALSKQAKADTISGITQIPTTAMGLYSGAKQLGLVGGTTTTTPISDAASTAATSAFSGVGSSTFGTTGYSAFGAGMAPTSGLSLYGGTGATGLIVPAGTLSGTTTGTGLTTGASLTGSTGTTTGAGSSTSALGVAGGYIGSAGAGYTAGTWAGKQAGNKRITKQVASFGGLIKGESTQRKLGGAFAGAGAGFGAGAAIGSIVPGVGTIIGGVIGAVVGGVSGASEQSVICSELNRQGLLPYKVLEYDSMYGKTLDREAYYGYRLWADKVVTLMQKSELFTKIVKPFGLAFAYESAHRMNPEIKGNSFGAVMLAIGVPLCKLIYKISEMNKTNKLEVEHGIS